MRDGSNEYRTILLLTDLTDKSLGALSYARAFADFYNSCLGVLHVLPQQKTRGEANDIAGKGQRRTAASVRKRLQSLAQALRSDGISAQVRLCRGPVTARTILRNIHTMHPDLIIQGCGGIDDFRRPFLGSIAEEILRSTNIPVLTVRAGLGATSSKRLRFNRILLATDFGSAVRTASLRAISLAREFGARLYLCHANDRKSDKQWSESDIRNFFYNELNSLKEDSTGGSCEVRCDKPSETILKLADRENCDLIVLGAHALGPLGSRGRPGTVFRVISRASCPVLTFSSIKRDDEARIEANQLEVIGA